MKRSIIYNVNKGGEIKYMKRSIFLLITAVLGTLFGLMMITMPDKAAEGFGVTATAELALSYQLFGSMILSFGVLNFIVRNHADSATLKAVLIFNVSVHLLTMIFDLYGGYSEIFEFTKIIPNQIIHLFIGIGSLMYLLKIKATS